MHNIFLTSSVFSVAKDIVKRFGIKGKLIFITTASEEKEIKGSDLTWQENDRRSLVEVGFEVTDYTISGKTEEDLRRDLKDMDIIYMSGGSTFYLLGKIKESNFDKVIKNLLSEGKIYISTSAGSIAAGIDIPPYYLEDITEEDSKSYSGLGLVDFTVLPHWGSDDFKDKYFADKRLEKIYRNGYKIVLLNNDQYIAVDENGYRIFDVTKD